MVAKLDNPCPRCGWTLAGFHLCLFDMSDRDVPKRATTEEYVEPKKRKSRARPGANRSDSVRRARANEAGRAERDAEILRLYDEMHHSINDVSKLMTLDQRTVSRVVREAADAGHIVFRGNTGRPARALASA